MFVAEKINMLEASSARWGGLIVDSRGGVHSIYAIGHESVEGISLSGKVLIRAGNRVLRLEVEIGLIPQGDGYTGTIEGLPISGVTVSARQTTWGGNEGQDILIGKGRKPNIELPDHDVWFVWYVMKYRDIAIEEGAEEFC